jgi:hypothetical protein
MMATLRAHHQGPGFFGNGPKPTTEESLAVYQAGVSAVDQIRLKLRSRVGKASVSGVSVRPSHGGPQYPQRLVDQAVGIL